MSRPAATLLAVLLLLLAGCASGRPRTHGDVAEPVKASFTVDPEIPQVGESVQFRDQSSGPVQSWAWDFGDGGQSTDASPIHAYDRAGLFEVQLRVRGPGAHEDRTAQFVQVGAPGTVGGFQIDFRFTITDLRVEFEPVPTPATSVVDAYYWEFGDGDVSRQSAPEHSYAERGYYTVKLRAISAGSVANATHQLAVGGVPGRDPGLATQSFVVVAVVDSGINPYHEEFRDPGLTVPPSYYVDGYPSDAEPLPLDLQAQDYEAAVDQDDALWKSVKAKELRWIPGTRIVGAISFGSSGPLKILDEAGHGTATASDAAGGTIGTCPTCLIVMVEASDGDSFEKGLEWALSQPWIDVVTNSWGIAIGAGIPCPASYPCSVDTGIYYPPAVYPAVATKAAVERGVEVFFSSGNGVFNGFDVPQITYWSGYSGPDWIVTVGAADASSGATIAGTGQPVDIVSFGLDWKGAAHDSLTTIEEFSGTSASAPVAAGAYATVVLAARAAMGDAKEGPHGGAVAVGDKGKGALADGKLTRHEAERALFVTASTASSPRLGVPAGLPNSAAAFAYRGYGLVTHATAKEAAKVVLGETAAPSRPTEDQWAAVDSRIRTAIWGNWEPGAAAASSPSEEAMRTWLSTLGLTAADLPASG